MRASYIFGFLLGVLVGSSAFGQTAVTRQCDGGVPKIMCPKDHTETDGTKVYADCQKCINDITHKESCEEECCPEECNAASRLKINNVLVCRYTCQQTFQ